MDMAPLPSHVDAAVQCLQAHMTDPPRVGIVLGTGLGGLVDVLGHPVSVSYAKIPHFPQARASGHAGCLVFGQAWGVPVVMMQGRAHLYEGYSAAQVAFPIRVMERLGVRSLVVSNASGGLNPAFARGDVMLIDDHINLMGRFGHTFSQRTHRTGGRPYDGRLLEVAERAAARVGFEAPRGVYAALTGPTYETRAEYRMLRRIGADVVGMSSVPEVLIGARLGMQMVGFSVVTNLCRPDTLESTSHAAVQSAAECAAPRLEALVESVVGNHATHR